MKEKRGKLEDVFLPVNDLAPLCRPSTDFEIHGWDISGLNLYESARRA